MKLLFINSLKGLKKRKIQMLGIILLVMLSTGIYVAMQSALDRMEDKYYKYLDNQSVEHLSVDYYLDYQKEVSSEELDYLKDNYFKNLSSDEKEVIDTYSCTLNKECKDHRGINPFDNPSFEYIIDAVFKKYGADYYLKGKKINSLKEKYDFISEIDRSKTLKEDKTYIKLIPYNKDKKINKAYLVEGHFPTKENEITMLPKYAKINKIKIGDKYKMDGKDYKVVGFTYAPDYIYPLVSYSAVTFDEETNNVMYINNDDYSKVNGVEEKTFSILYNGNVKRKFELENTSIDKKDKVSSTDVTKILHDDSNVNMSIFTVTRLGRISSLQLEFKTDRMFANYFLYILLGISVFVIAIITKKRIEDEKIQIGVLKSLGYSRFSIAVSYLVYPIIGSIIGGLLGYIIGLIANGPLANVYISYFVLPLGNFKIDPKYLSNCLILPTVLLSTLSYLIALFMLRKKPLALLREGSNLKVNFLSKLANKITRLLPFKYKFKYNLAFRSISKLLIVAITSFFTGMLIVLTLIGCNLMQKLVDKSFEGLKYEYMVYTNAVETEEIDADADHMINANFPVKKIISKTGKNKKVEKDLSISVSGIDKDSKYISVLDKKNKNIINLLKDENGMIINENMKSLYNINVGDTLVLDINEEGTKTIQYKVIGIAEEFMNMTGYVDRLGLSKKIGYDKSSYTSLLSKDKKYSNLKKLDQGKVDKIATVINFKDMKKNINKTIKKYNASIYIVISFASIMAFVIIAVIANIVVEENKKTISLMKVMGYKNKRISSIVLNIYTPIIIISYLISIPMMISLLKKIINILAGDMKMTIPVTLDPVLAGVGLVGLLVAYYIAIALSKRVLNKIPLAVALKRE